MNLLFFDKMFEPQFTYTDKIVSYIAKISSAKQVIDSSSISSVYGNKLKRDAFIKSAHYSTSIEGNPLNLKKVESLIKNNYEPSLKEEREVINYFNTLNKYSDKNITQKTILSIHKDLLGNSDYGGEFRDTQVVIGNLHEINYVPPEDYKVHCLVDDLLDWLNNSTAEMYPVIIAGIFHYEFVRIHPFIDGNGRTSRLLTTLILSGHGFDNYFSLDEFYNRDILAYVEALKSADRNHDLTNWLEYFCRGVLYSIDKVKSQVLDLAKITSKYDNTIELALNEISVLNILKKKKFIQNKNIQQELNISHQASYKIIRKLKNKGLIKSRGKGRNTEYVLS